MLKESPRRHPDMLEVLKLFRVIFGSQKRHYRALEQASAIGGAQMWALSEIHRSPAITVGELARKLAIHRSTATNLVNRLEALQLVTKRREGRDQRLVLLESTPRGATIVGKGPRPVMGILQRALLDIPPTTLQRLNRDLAALVNIMKPKDGKAGSTPLADL